MIWGANSSGIASRTWLLFGEFFPEKPCFGSATRYGTAWDHIQLSAGYCSPYDSDTQKSTIPHPTTIITCVQLLPCLVRKFSRIVWTYFAILLLSIEIFCRPVM